MPKLRVHIGHHFYGAGNLGDDLMLAGFLEAARPVFLARADFTCCSPHDIASQRRRFPEIEWLPYAEDIRMDCVGSCDAWLGLGGTPFQATGGRTWLLDHLEEEAAWCRRAGVPMFYLGVGVNERAVAALPQTRRLIDQAGRMWLRDEHSLEMLAGITRPGQATADGDLAHLALAAMRFPDPEPGTLGVVLIFEDPAQFHPNDLAALARGVEASPWRARWLAQEVRPLEGSETFLHGLLPPEALARVPLRIPDYAGTGSARALLVAWEGLDAIFTSRYHTALIGAWTGARVVVFARNDKVAGAARQLGLATVPGMGDTAAIFRALDDARPVERTRLTGLADRARGACEEFFNLVGETRPRSLPGPAAPAGFSSLPASVTHSDRAQSAAVPSQPSSRLLFLRPDAYGDLILFEPVLRIVREVWPEVEIAVLIRRAYQDITPLLGADVGARWLTTDCDPYRETPGANPAALAALGETLRAFAPDCLVAACAEQTWLEAAAASFLPGTRQISLGGGIIGPVAHAALDAALPVDWETIYPEKIPVEAASREWEKNLVLAGALLDREVPRWWPVARVPEPAREHAARILAGAGLTPGAFAVCAAAGTATVRIKSWPAEHYGDTLAWLERERGVRALLVGHASERGQLEAVRQRAVAGGGDPALWTGRDGEMPVLAGLLAAGSFYFGNDTGALHLAAALGKPVAAIFGGGAWPRFRPLARRAAVVVQPLPCFGCGWKCYFGDAPCVREIPVDAGRRALEWLLSSDKDAETEITVADAISPQALDLICGTTAAHRAQGGDRGGAGDAPSQQALTDLFKQLAFSEADRAERLAAIEKQGAEISRLHAEVDRQLKEAGEFWPQLDAAVNERNLLTAQLADLRGQFEGSEADRASRLEVIESQSAEIVRLHVEIDRQVKEAAELWPKLDAAANERNLLAAQLADARRQFESVEADSAARLEVIERQGAEISRLHAEVDRQLKEAGEFWPRLDAAANERNLLAAQLADLRAHFEGSEADRAARLVVIENQGAFMGLLHTQVAASEAERERVSVEADGLRATHAALQTQFATVASECERLSAEAGESNAAHSDLQSRFAATEAERARLSTELAAERRHRETLESHWTARLLKKAGFWPL